MKLRYLYTIELIKNMELNSIGRGFFYLILPIMILVSFLFKDEFFNEI